MRATRCACQPVTRLVQYRLDIRVLPAHVANVIVPVLNRKMPLNRAILRCPLGMRTQVIAKSEFVNNFRMIDRINVNMMGSSLGIVLGEVEAARCPRNLGVETLTPNSVA